MPAAIPLVAAVAGSAVTGAIGTGILASVAGFVVSTAISQIGGRMLAKKPKQQAFSAEAEGRSTVIRSSVESHKIIYGQAKVSGPLVFVTTTDNGTGAATGPKANKMLHLVIALAGHEVEEIAAVYFNDRLVTLDGSGFVTTAPYQKSTSSTSMVGIPASVIGASRTSNVVTLTTSGPHTYQPGEGVVVTGLLSAPGFIGQFIIASVPSPTTFTYASSGSNTTLVIGDPGQAVVTRAVTTTTTTNYALVRTHLGADDQEADPFMVASIPGWTSQHRLRGIPYLYVRLEYDQDVFPLGIPNVSAVVKGKKVYDPRTDTTAWSDNAALCTRDYFASGYGFDCADDEINDTYFEAAANVSDESVALIGGGTQARYTCNGVVDTATAPLENLNGLLTSMAGVVTFVQGQFRLYAGAYDMPAADVIDEDMLAGPITIRARTPRKELFNAVKGTYVDPDKSWQPTDFPFVTNATYETQDGGERIFRDVELPYTTHPQAAQRTVKILLEKARQGIVVETTLKHHALQFCAYDVVKVTNTQLGWSEKPFRLLKWRISDVGAIGVVMQEESSASYDWASGEATENDPAPDTNLPDPFTVVPPGAPQITETLYSTNDGSGVKSKATVMWEPSTDAFVSAYQVEYRPVLASDYAVAGQTLKEITTLDIFDIAPGVYDFRVKAINSLGVSSPYSTTTQEIFGLTAPPADISNFSLNAINNNAHVTWDQVADLDVRVGGFIRIRYTPETGSPTWASAIDIGPALPGIATSAVLPLLDGTYLIKAVDSAGNESVNAATIRSTVANIVKMNQVAVAQEAPTFPGTKTSMEVVDGVLRLGGEGNFDDLGGDFDDAPGLFDMGGGLGYELSGGYQFDGYIDVGKVTTSRVTAAIEASVFSETIDFDDAEGDFDDRGGLFDGGDEANISIRLEVRTTDDNPAGTPVWSDWRQFFVGDYTCRAYQFRILVTSLDATNNVQIISLGVSVDMPDILDSGTITTSAAGLTAVTFNRTFVVAPDIGVAIQNAQTGDFEVVSSVTPTGFQFGVKNAAGSFVARSGSYVASGY